MSSSPTFLMVGAGLAAAKAAETLRAEGFGGRVLLFGDEAERPHDRPPLSKGYLRGETDRDVPLDQVASEPARHRSGVLAARSDR
jgi:3-phenylpropionate/trans-cinnamate dioxygenase ferredoxin reductase subunit